MEEEGLPDVRCARTLEEAVAMPTDGRTITVIVAAALGQMPYITPGAYADHIEPYANQQQRWMDLVRQVRAQQQDPEGLRRLVDALHQQALRVLHARHTTLCNAHK